LHGGDTNTHVSKIPAQFGEVLQLVQAAPALRRFLLSALPEHLESLMALVVTPAR